MFVGLLMCGKEKLREREAAEEIETEIEKEGEREMTSRKIKRST